MMGNASAHFVSRMRQAATNACRLFTWQQAQMAYIGVVKTA
jgi:hypothetical protein